MHKDKNSTIRTGYYDFKPAVPGFEVLGHDLIRIFHCNEQSGEINTLLVHSGIEVSEIWLAGMEPTDYLLKMTGGAKSDSDDAK